MPFIHEEYHTPDAAVASGYCPECGKSLALTTAELEIGFHWPRGVTEEVCSAEGLRRAGLITAFFRKSERS